MPDSPFAPQPYHRGNLREAVLAAAEQTLRESGIDGLSLRQIARDLRVSHGAPSRHFRDRQALLDALASLGFQRLRERFEAVDGARSPSDAFQDRLHAVGQAYLGFAVENPALLELMFARKHGGAAGLEESVAQAFSVPRALILEGQQRDEIMAGDPTTIGLAAIASLHGLASFLGSGFVSDDRAEALLTQLTHQLLDGLRPR